MDGGPWVPDAARTSVGRRTLPTDLGGRSHVPPGLRSLLAD